MITREKGQVAHRKELHAGTSKGKQDYIYMEEGITRRQERYHYPEPNVFSQVKVMKQVNQV